MRKLLSTVRSAIDDYKMIDDGDRIAIGVSGGKDSVALLSAMARLRMFYPKKFEIEAITLDMGAPGMDFSSVIEHCKNIGVNYTIIPTNIYEVVFDIRKESHPCSLCAKLRRGALHDNALKLGCKKVALGHHYDDVLETFFLSLFYEGRVNCFSPVTYLDRTDIHLIRPLIYTHEKDIRSTVNRLGFPVVHNPCPANGHTKREEMKQLIRTLAKDNKDVRKRLFTAIQSSSIDGWHVFGESFSDIKNID